MLFSEMIKKENCSLQNAFLLWMIYEWPIFIDEYSKILAYSWYKIWTWSRSNDFLNNSKKTKEDYLFLHHEKLEHFLWSKYYIEENSTIKRIYDISNNKNICDWISVIIDFDLVVPKWLNIESYLLWIIEKWLIDVDDNYKDIFLAWAMDWRWSLDFSWNFFTIDLAQRDFPEIAKRKLFKFNDIMGMIFNYNPRLTQANSNQKNDQFRINLNYYTGKYWLFTPYKIDYYKFEKWLTIKDDNDFFFYDQNNKGISLSILSSERNLKINDLAIRLKQQDLTFEDKKYIIDQYKRENFIDDDDDEILHSSQNVKEAAKIRDDYKCEFDNSHKSFHSKANNRDYVEAHHLIPFCERKKFDLSIDVVENIVCLCPNCHRKIHLAINEEKQELLNLLFEKKTEDLKSVWIQISKEELFHYYWIN